MFEENCLENLQEDVLASELKKLGFRGEIFINENLKAHSTFKIGGTAKIFLAPADCESLVSALTWAESFAAPYFVLGGGSNVVFADEGFAGVIVATKNFSGISPLSGEAANLFEKTPSSPNDAAAFCQKDFCFVRCGSGVPLADFVSYCTENALSGAEEFAGLPGTIGGAVYMNARCFDKSVSDLLWSAEFIDLSEIAGTPASSASIVTHTMTAPFSESEWGYKQTPFQNTRKVIVAATFRLQKMTGSNTSSEKKSLACKKIFEKCEHFVAEREKRGHFKFPSAGSVFKNNRSFGVPSGKLIDEAGLRGTQIGGAQIAPFHGNFIINIGGATAGDVRALVSLATEKVRERTGFVLEPEIIFVASDGVQK